ncbi:prolipoprotein diacylglyceryl transferase [Mycobacterium sp. ITM-2016-00318]|uniref:prolipoprotein diacylglyceryl transferase n=1 Tax=Mycobacterium sp. ITM-2016-00318 TaxID=2099693 RepID=UPI000CFA6791|nr:prolipoprotein diacylglyceryl transferase [Mycobacterium sp. ITM-2016-00318]WNG95252.1 prolipoprotein diacylglyceryl transferase [Mycobacterium sp. ITM-2016-00318]
MTTTILASFPSPSQGVWHLGTIPIRAYAMFILLGVIAALFIGNKRWVDRGGERGVIFDIALWAIIFGLIGGRLYHVLTDWSTYFGSGGAGLVAAFKIQEGGLGIWGAVALGGVGAWIGCRRKGIPLPAFGDAIAPGIVLAQAIGRIGNYFNQELYGRTTSLPWGLEIYERRDSNGALDTLNGVSTGQLIEVVHPAFLYELLWNLVVFVLLLGVDRRFRIGHGRLFALYVAAYCFGRFWVELMRSDMAWTPVEGIRINSFVSVFVFIGAVVYIMVAPKGREDPSELRGYAEDADGAAPGANLPTEKIEKELVAVAATTGVVAAAKAAGEKEDEDATEILESGGEELVEPRDEEKSEVEAVAESEQLAEDIADVPAGELMEAEAFAEAGEDAEPTVAIGGVGSVEGDEVAKAEETAPEVHEDAVANAEEAADVADEVAAEGDAATDGGEEPVTEVGGVGSVEGDEVAEAEAAAAEAHEAAVEEAEEAADVADEAAEEADDETETETEVEAEDAADAADDETEAGEDASDPAADGGEEPDSEVGGVGSVEGDEAVEAEAAAAEVHEAAVENAEEAAGVADEVAAEGDGTTDGGEEPLTEVGGVGSVEGDVVAEAAPEVHEAADANAEEAAEAGDEAEEPEKEVGGVGSVGGVRGRLRERWRSRRRRG